MGDVRKPGHPPARGSQSFSPEEPGSFGSRATPVVPVSSVDSFLATRQPPAARLGGVTHGSPLSVHLRGPSSEGRTDRLELGSSQPPGTSEHDFWDSPPKYSAPPASLPFSEPARPRPSTARKFLTKMLFLAVLLPALALMALALYMLVTGHRPSSFDLRAMMSKLSELL